MEDAHLDPEVMAAYVDGRLAEDRRRDANGHIDRCSTCRQELSALVVAMDTHKHEPPMRPSRNLRTGELLGPYEIVELLGAGGMGAVYRARDTRLQRDVALKILPADVREDPDARQRFKREARAVGRLSHPNIVVIHDVDVDAPMPYVVSELLEGMTLRKRLELRPLSPREVTEFGIQIVRGLVEAHDKGIVHRDLKPENLFLTTDGNIKILDFGLAKRLPVPTESTDVVASIATVPGTVMGTAGYMSPEQVQGEAIDARTDIFSIGVVLFELASGRRPFEGTTFGAICAAIVHEPPPALAPLCAEPIGALDAVVARCLQKRPQDRFASARELLAALTASGAISQRTQPARPRAIAPAARRPLVLGAAVLVLAAGALVLGMQWRRSAAVGPGPSYTPLTFQRGTLWNARFAPDGKTIVYAGAWSGRDVEPFVQGTGPEPRAFGVAGAQLLAVSKSGELALALGWHATDPYIWQGTLARVPLAGGSAPREVLADVSAAEFTRTGELAIVRRVGDRVRLELPVGHVLVETTGWISDVRASPTADVLAFVEHQDVDEGGTVAIVDAAGHRRDLTQHFDGALGLAWSPRGDAVWFTAWGSELGALWAVALDGKQRLITRGPGRLHLYDVAPDGRALVAVDDFFRGVIVGSEGGRERELSWLDWTSPTAISGDGKQLLFYDTGHAVGLQGAVYLRAVDGSPPVRLANGISRGLSADGKVALVMLGDGKARRAQLVPTGAGTPRTIDTGAIEIHNAWLFPDGERVLVQGTIDHPHDALWIAGPGAPKLLWESDESGIDAVAISPDGKRVAVIDDAGRLRLIAVADGTAKLIGDAGGNAFARWDGDYVYLYRYGQLPVRIVSVDLATGTYEPWREIELSDAAGIWAIVPVLFAADGRAWAYGYVKLLSKLYVVDGLR